jgi:hypothetical protein
MPSIYKRLRAAAVTAACATAAVTMVATPSDAAGGIGVIVNPQPIVREVVDAADALPDPGDIVDPADVPGCDPTTDTYYCIAVGSVVFGPVPVASVAVESQNVTNVIAYMDVYKVDATVVGGDFLTCVSLTSPVPVDPCGDLDLELVSRTPILDQPVDSYEVQTDPSNPITTVTVCRADISGKIAGRSFFVQGYTVC